MNKKKNLHSSVFKGRKRQERWLILFSMALLLVYIGIFNYFPIAYSFIGSFFEWKPIKGIFRFEGFDNYAWMLSEPLFWKSMSNTLVFALAACFFYVALGLIFATLIYMSPRFQGFFRTTYFLPVITSGVAVSLLWKYAFYNTNNGIFNVVLEFFGLPPQMWLLDENQVLPCIILMTVWKEIGYAIIIFIAGLNEIPGELFEAATIDGGSRFQCFRYIIIPRIKPTTMLVAVTWMINFLQVFNQVMLMTSTAGKSPGGPGTSSYTMMLLIYEKGFQDFNFGRASAIGYALVLIILVFTLIQFRLNAAED